jgi:hypothetical protein
LGDVLYQRGQSRSKVDYYSKHLFLCILRHELGEPDDLNALLLTTPTLTELPRSSSPPPFNGDDMANDRDVSYEKEEHDKRAEGDDLPMYNGRPSISKRARWRRPLLPRHQRDMDKTIEPRSKLTRLAGMQRDVSPPYDIGGTWRWLTS